MPRGGRVINISTIAAKGAIEDPLMSYGASKAAPESITRSVAKEFAAKKGITVNSLQVGPTDTGIC